jgi:RIO-like serine/threonine protein kinase
MVVMEYIDGETLAKAKPSLNKETIEIVRLKLQKALELLHGQGLVIGDLRSPNVFKLITKARQVKLIDFDWAGEEGQTKDPYLISPGIDWREGVKALAVI